MGLLINTADIKRKSVGAWGKETVAVIAAGAPCRIEYGNRLVRDFHGELVPAHVTVFFPRGTDVRAGDWVSWGGVDHSVLNIERLQDASGEHHVEVYVA